MTFGERLKELRTQRGYTQEDLARIFKTSRSRICMYEKGQREPDFEMLETFADFFNVNMNYLLGKESHNVPDYTPDMLNLIEMYSDLTEQKKEMLMNYITFLHNEQ